MTHFCFIFDFRTFEQDSSNSKHVLFSYFYALKISFTSKVFYPLYPRGRNHGESYNGIYGKNETDGVLRKGDELTPRYIPTEINNSKYRITKSRLKTITSEKPISIVTNMTLNLDLIKTNPNLKWTKFKNRKKFEKSRKNR